MKLKRATTKDISELLEIEKTTVGLKVYSRWKDEKEMKERLDNEIVCFIENDGAIVGSISYEILNENHAEVSAIVIKPEFQKQGLGRKAMDFILKKLSDFKRITIEVHPDNHSMKLYESLGFKVESRAGNRYDGEPRLIMIKKQR